MPWASHVLSLDLGTSSVKAMVARLDGEPVSSHAVKTPVRTARELGPLAKEFSPASLWSVVVLAAQGALERGGLSGNAIAAVGVTTQRQGLALLDRAGRALYLGPNTDLRAVFEGAAQDEQHRKEFYRTTGHLPPFFMAPAKLRWFQVHHPALYDRVATVMTVGDWLVFRLTGERAGERALAGEAGLLDISAGTWARRLMSALALRDDWFPPMVSTGAVVGLLTKLAAAEIGLPPRVPVVAAGPDTQCGLLGLGVAQPGRVGALAGWSLTIQAVTEKPCFDSAMNSWVGLHALPNRWVCEANLGATGAALSWVARTLYGNTRQAMQRLDRDAATVEPGGDGAMAFLGVGPLDMMRLGVHTGGMLFPVPVTHTSASRATLARAAMESVAFGVREGLERLEKVSGVCPPTMAIGGGLVRSGPLPGIIAGATGREVRVSSVHHVSAYGAALAASVVVGGSTSLAEAAEWAGSRLTSVPAVHEEVLAYDEWHARWTEARRALEQVKPV